MAIYCTNEVRIGICKHTKQKVLQIKDEHSDDAPDKKGWLCLHQDNHNDEISDILEFKFKIKGEITNN